MDSMISRTRHYKNKKSCFEMLCWIRLYDPIQHKNFKTASEKNIN